jgi:hypothetical protein
LNPYTLGSLYKGTLNPLSPEAAGESYSEDVFCGTGLPHLIAALAGRCLTMTYKPDEALDVLRGVWSAQGQTSADLADCDSGKSCKRMADVGFSWLEDTDGDVRSAWRATLQREGKLNPDAMSVKDLVLGPAEASTAEASTAEARR